MIGTFIHQYRIVSKIGEGGMGTVWLADHPSRGLFAIKALAPELSGNREYRERFYDEARILFSLQHSNIVQPYSLLEQDDQLFLVMEYVDGTDLHTLIKQEGPLDEKKALKLFKDALIGLNFAHSRGIIHRDIKPSNILVSKDYQAKIMDFGIAIAPDGKRLTRTGFVLGTAHYMSPEQITHPRQIDHRSDVYSMGIVLYEMLTGQVPFDGDCDYKIYKKHVEEKPPDISAIVNISPTLRNIILKALEKNPDDRFAGCGEFLQYIQAHEIEQKRNGDPEPPFPKITDKKTSSGVSIAGGVFITIAVIVGLILFFVAISK